MKPETMNEQQFYHDGLAEGKRRLIESLINSRWCVTEEHAVEGEQGKTVMIGVPELRQLAESIETERNFKCPNHPTANSICPLPYACDACPFNPEIVKKESTHTHHLMTSDEGGWCDTKEPCFGTLTDKDGIISCDKCDVQFRGEGFKEKTPEEIEKQRNQDIAEFREKEQEEAVKSAEEKTPKC